MPTVINNSRNSEDSGGMTGALMGVFVLVVALILFFVYGLPMMRNTDVPAQEESESNRLDVNVTLPTSDNTPTEPNQ